MDGELGRIFANGWKRQIPEGWIPGCRGFHMLEEDLVSVAQWESSSTEQRQLFYESLDPSSKKRRFARGGVREIFSQKPKQPKQ